MRIKMWIHCWHTGPWFNIKMPFNQYRKSHCKDKTVSRSSCLYNGISYKTTSFYWIKTLGFWISFALNIILQQHYHNSCDIIINLDKWEQYSSCFDVHVIRWCHNRADSRLAPSQWETSLQSNAVSHWLGANLESALNNDYYDNMPGLDRW